MATLDDEMVTMEILDTAGQVKKKEKGDKSLLCNGENYNASQLCVRKPGDGRRVKTVSFVRLV